MSTLYEGSMWVWLYLPKVNLTATEYAKRINPLPSKNELPYFLNIKFWILYQIMSIFTRLGQVIRHTSHSQQTELLGDGIGLDIGFSFLFQLWGNIFLSMASLVICMQLRYLFYEFQRRIKRHKNYRRVVQNMEERCASKMIGLGSFYIFCTIFFLRICVILS